MNSYSVYKHIFPNNKVYIGITKNEPKKRWKNGYGYSTYKKSKIYSAIQKYGWENVKHEILFENLTKEEAEQKEIELITQYKSTQKEYGYNISNGGNHNGKHNEETKRKISISKKGTKLSDETKRKMSISKIGKKHWNYGKKASMETKIKLSKSHLGQKAWNKGMKRCDFLTKEQELNLMKLCREKNIGNKYSCKPIICVETGTIYEGIKDAYNKTKINFSNISQVCNKKRKTAGGYHWEYLNKGE